MMTILKSSLTLLSGRRRANAAWLLVDYGLRLVIGAVVAALVTRYLGPAQAGILSYSIALVAFVQPFTTWDSAVINLLVRVPDQRPTILGTATALKLGASIVAYVLLVLAIKVLQPQATAMQLVVLIVALQLLCQIGDVVDYDLQSRLQGYRIVRARICAALVASAVRLAMIGLMADLTMFAAIIPAEALLTSMFIVLGSDRHPRSIFAWNFSCNLARRLWTETWPLALSGVLIVASTHADKLLLGQLRGPVDVGIYFAAYQLSGLWYFLALIACSSAAPDLARYFGNDLLRYQKLQGQAYSALTATGVLIAIVASAFSDEIIRLLFGPAFQDSAGVLRIHIWTGVFVFHMHMRARIFVIEGKQNFVLIFSVATLITNIALNAWWIPKYGTHGAACASVVSWGLCAVVFPLFSKQTRAAAHMFVNSFNPISWWRLSVR